MNIVIDGKKKIEQFVYALKAFHSPILLIDDSRVQILEVPDCQQLNDINKSDLPGRFLEFTLDFFWTMAVGQRDIHLQFAQPTCRNINLQQKVIQLNSELKSVAFQFPAQSIYKTLRPVSQKPIKQLTISVCHQVSEGVKQIVLSFIISANLDSGFFVIQKPVAPMRRLSENLEGPVKIASFSADDCKQLRDQLKSQNLRLEFTEDEVKVSPSLDGTLEISYVNSQMRYYNASLVEQMYGNLVIPQIYNSTFQPVMKFATRMKEDMSLHIKHEENRDVVNIYFMVKSNSFLLAIRQSAMVNQVVGRQQNPFSVDEELIEELQSQQIQSAAEERLKIQQQQQQAITVPLKQKQESVSMHYNRVRNNLIESPFNMEHSPIKMMQDDDQFNTFIPPKVTGSINDFVLEILQGRSRHTMSTLQQ